MWFSKKSTKIGVTGVSVLGGLSHITAQFAVSAAVFGSWAVFSVYPLSAIISLAAAVVVGIISYIVVGAIKKAY
jgi:heptaprenyl diphosphate synthase